MKMSKLFVLFFALCIAVSAASAVNLQFKELEINNRGISLDVENGTVSKDFERGEKLDLYVCVEALADVSYGQVYADISGYRYSTQERSKVSDVTDTFDLTAGHEKCFDLNLEVPTKIDKDFFKLRISAADRNGAEVSKTYQLYLTGTGRNNAVEIKDFVMNPEQVPAGRAFTSKVKIKNIGDDDIADLKVTLSVPGLGLRVSEFMEDLEADESRTFEELLLRVPDCARAGDYDVEILVEYDEYEQTETVGQVSVVGSDTCPTNTVVSQDKTVVSVPMSQDVAQGTSVVYPVMIANTGSTAKTYTLSVSGVSTWGTTRVDPSAVVVVPAGQSKTVYVYVSANSNAEAGDKAFTVSIDSGSESKQVPVIAKISEGSANWGSLKQVLEVGLVVLVIVLIIVGLVVGFNKLKDNKNETEPYY